jgi:hypothetical protein
MLNKQDLTTSTRKPSWNYWKQMRPYGLVRYTEKLNYNPNTSTSNQTDAGVLLSVLVNDILN